MLPVVVATVYAPRPKHEKYIDYLPLIREQKASAERFGHKHLVLTDCDLGSDLRQARIEMPTELMPAMIAGVIAGLKRAHRKRHMVFLDADCLVNKPLNPAFPGGWDLALCRRSHETSLINNGAMFIDASGISRAIGFFDKALAICGTHWGADQEAISEVASPVPEVTCLGERAGAMISFVSMKSHAAVPTENLWLHKSFTVHFKGDTKKWMAEYAKRHLQ